jgi:hypothetical protein
MDEGRKRVVLIAAAILVARHLKNAEDLNDYRPTPRSEALIANAIRLAERIMKKIDAAYPVGEVPQSGIRQ